MALNLSSKYFNFVNTVLRTQAVYSPWDVIVTSTGTSSYSYLVVPSTLNGVVPNNYLTARNATTASPEYIYLNVSATTGRVSSVAIGSDSSPTEAPEVLEALPPSSFIVPIGVIGTNGVYYKFLQAKPIIATPSVSFSADRVAPIPGLSPRVQWWTWTITQP